MEKKRLIIISSIGIGIVLLLTIVGIFIYQFFVNKGHVKEFDVDFIHQQAIPYDNLFRVKCDNVDEVKAGDELVCNVSISPDLQNYSIMDDVLEWKARHKFNKKLEIFSCLCIIWFSGGCLRLL